ncbi:MAG TPA: universal stress protein [Balneolaceae bacterium]|nr:universal stress protein [Balneolaceae bacterium]
MKILVPLDFSDLSFKALQVADKFSSVYDDVSISPFHAHIPISELDEPYAFGLNTPVHKDFDEIEANIKERLKEAAGKYIDESKLGESIVGIGSPSQCIIDISEEMDFDYVIMSTHGRTGFSRFFLGSVAEKVLRLSSIPVMVVENESKVDNFEKILVTTDFSDNATIAFPYAVEIAKKTGGHIHLVHVLSFEQFEADEKDTSLKQIRKERMKIIEKEYFHQISDQVTSEVIVSPDSPHEELLNHISKNDYNLIVMSTVGRTGINYLMMGSTTANVVRHVNNAVLSINPKKTTEKEGDEDEDES